MNIIDFVLIPFTMMGTQQCEEKGLSVIHLFYFPAIQTFKLYDTF